MKKTKNNSFPREVQKKAVKTTRKAKEATHQGKQKVDEARSTSA